MARPLFAIACHPGLITHPGGQITNGDTDDQHHGKGQQVLHITDGERPFGLYEEQIEAGDVDHRGQHRRPTAKEQGDKCHAQQVNHHQVSRINARQ
ncbi:hypothetical protein D3C75_1089650 [compost metagenome]